MSSMANLAPVYHANQFSTSRGQLIPTTAVEEPVVEHEHHHIHHHIDHGNVTVTRREQRTIDESYEQDRRYRTHEHPHHHHHHYRHRSNGSSRGYSRSDVDLSQMSGSRRGSVQVSGTSDWTIIDVPPGTRRITLDTTGVTRNDHDINWSRYNGVRRSHGLGSELWTEITKDLVTREAIEDLNYPYEETDHFYYIFDYLNREQIDDLIHLTADIRRERARDLEYNSIANSSRLIEPAPVRYGHYDDRHRDEHSEIVYTEEQTRRRSRKYHY
ncbi:hypothetical protein BDZ91DRAFT_429290 [Kalaharituber pfeilii]|nr:hypothetical protein BDZ91DRAFT_429290 [Kalaharituber pfeilii]